MTAWLSEYANKHMSKLSRVYQLNIGPGAFMRVFVTHRNALTTAVKRTSRTKESDKREGEEMLKEDLERNVMLCLHNNFCRKRETSVDPLPCCKQKIEEQMSWRTASICVRMATDVLQDTETESAESMWQEEEMENKMQKGERLEEFRSFRTSKRLKTRRSEQEVKKEVTKDKMLKLRIVYVRKTQMRNQAFKLAIETE